MAEYLTLGTAQFNRMLDVLVAEQSALRRRFFWFRLQKAAFYLLTVALGIALLGLVVPQRWSGLGEHVFGFAVVVGGIACLAIVPLFFINLPFAWRLFKQELLRRRLGLEEALHERLKTAGKKRWVMFALSLVGLVVAATAIWYMASEAELDRGMVLGELIRAIWLPVTVLVVGLSVPGLWLMSRGVDRLEEVSRLRDRLKSDASPEARDSGQFEVSFRDYDRVARIEKVKALDDRHRSVRKGAKLAKASIYAVQRSFEAQSAIERLDAKARMQVEETIFGLMAKPRPKQVREDSPGRLSLQVPDSLLVLSYEVDEENERIRIHGLRTGGTKG